MPNPITLPTTGQTINDRTEVSGLITSELAAWIDLGYFPGGGGSGNAVTLQGKAISVTAPTANQVLEWSGTAWVPTTLPSSQPLNSVLTALEAVMSATATATAQRTALGLGSAALSNTSAFDAAGAAAAAQAAAIAASDPSGSAAAAQAAAIAASQPLNSVLTALASVMSSTATAAAQRTALGLGTAAVSNTGDFDASGAAAAAQAAAIAASQPVSSVLTALASVMSATATAAAQRTALGLGGAALLAVGTSAGTVAAGDDARFSTVTGNNQTGTTYTFVLTDAGEVVEGNNGAGIAFTIPPVSSVVWPVGTVIEVWQQGAGQITLTAGAGVTLRSDGAKVKTAAQYATVRARMRANDEWVLSGDLA